ncbi:hypothetical protein H4R19_001414 [Coemansia spiralis]|nr:hypothetical protein H4R19_001414 [Coemansia spiralis]
MPPQSGTGDEAQGAGDAAQGTGDMVQGLSDTAQTIGHSLQLMQRALVGNMEQAVQLTLSMNQMMEELVKRSMCVGVFARRPAAVPPGALAYHTGLVMSVKNGSPVPLQGAHVKLWFTPHRSQLAHEVHAQVEPMTGGIALAPKSGRLPSAECGPESEPFAQTAEALGLASGAAAEAHIVLSVDTLEQLSGRIAVEFPSPGTGQLLRVEHRFGIHLLQLAACSFVHADAASLVAVDGVEHVDVDLGRARDIFAVPPADGITPGSVLAIQVGESRLGLRVRSIHDNAPVALCEWVAEVSCCSANVRGLMPRLADELRAREAASQ